jgi:predicted dehydrogenase
LASSFADGSKLVTLAAERGLVLMLDHTYCYTPAVQRLREIVRSGQLGELQYIDSVRINLGLVQPDIDVLWDLAPHDLSILDAILPDDVVPVSVAAHGSDPIGAGQVCVAYVSVQLSNGAMAHAHVGGSQRTVVWDDLNPSQRLAVYDRGVDRDHPEQLDDADRKRAQVSYRIGDMVAPALPEGEALRGVLAEFADAIATARAPLTDGRSGLRVLALLEAATESLYSGGSFVPVYLEEIAAEGDGWASVRGGSTR